MIVTRLALYCVCDHENFLSFKIALLFDGQCPWHPEKHLGTPRRRSLEIALPSICSCLEAQQNVSSMTLLANVCFLRRLSPGVVLLALGEQCKSFLCALSLFSRNKFPRAVSMYGRVGCHRAGSIHGCTGSSSVPIELHGRVTSVTCDGLVPKRISVSELVCEISQLTSTSLTRV